MIAGQIWKHPYSCSPCYKSFSLCWRKSCSLEHNLDYPVASMVEIGVDRTFVVLAIGPEWCLSTVMDFADSCEVGLVDASSFAEAVHTHSSLEIG